MEFYDIQQAPNWGGWEKNKIQRVYSHGTAIVKIVYRFLTNETGTILPSSNFTFVYTPRGNKTSTSIRYLHFHAHCSIIHKIQDMEIT